MDYEKEYNHAFEIAKGYWGGVNDFVRGILESMFPQLAESEDERIRKQIEQVLIEHDWSATYKVSKDDCLDYIEKQKRQKDSTPDDIAAAYQMGLAKGRREQKPELCDMGRWDEESYNNGIHSVLQNPEEYGLTKQKPAEWSEEDENAFVYLHELISFGFTEKFYDSQTVADMRDWVNRKFESLRPQPKQEWSGEDKKFIKHCADVLDEQGEPIVRVRPRISPPQPHWKPSKEQIEVFFKAVPVNLMPDELAVYHSLYNDLKKL